jgi:hypothetical protein
LNNYFAGIKINISDQFYCIKTYLIETKKREQKLERIKKNE